VREPDGMQYYLSQIRRAVTEHWRILLSGILIVGLLGGILFSARHQIHAFVKALTAPPSHPVHITPLALTPGATSSPPTPLTSSDWTTYHQNNSRTGLVTGTPDSTGLAPFWNRSLDGDFGSGEDAVHQAAERAALATLALIEGRHQLANKLAPYPNGPTGS
jgi:hypothetical protein